MILFHLRLHWSTLSVIVSMAQFATPSCVPLLSKIQSTPSRDEAQSESKAMPDPDAFNKKDELEILVFGDSGTAQSDQFGVGKAMFEHCYPSRTENPQNTAEHLEECDLAFVLGDIIYETGASSENDPLFETAFKSIYDRFYPMVFWIVLGNHDWGNPTEDGSPFGVSPVVRKGGNGHERARNPQIYTRFAQRRPAEGGSRVWTQPGVNYSFSYELASAGLDVTAIDTQTLLVQPKQRIWLRETLEKLSADDSENEDNNRMRWRILIGHVPLYSSSRHQNMDDRLRTLLLHSPSTPESQPDHLNLCGKVHLYLAGHDHNQQFLESKECPDGQKLYQVVSGAASKTEHKDDELLAQKESPISKLLHGRSHDLGFTKLSVTKDQLKVSYFTVSGASQSPSAELDKICVINRDMSATCRDASATARD